METLLAARRPSGETTAVATAAFKDSIVRSQIRFADAALGGGGGFRGGDGPGVSAWSGAVLLAVLGIESRGTMPGAVRTLGEIALRVNDLEVMRAFYERVVGLELMREFPGVAFFRLGEGYGGHTTVLALFDRDTSVGPEQTTLDHIAFTIDIADYEPEKKRLESAGLKVRPVVFDWVGWRSLFFKDPEGNSLEFVCRDPELNPQ